MLELEKTPCRPGRDDAAAADREQNAVGKRSRSSGHINDDDEPTAGKPVVTDARITGEGAGGGRHHRTEEGVHVRIQHAIGKPGVLVERAEAAIHGDNELRRPDRAHGVRRKCPSIGIRCAGESNGIAVRAKRSGLTDAERRGRAARDQVRADGNRKLNCLVRPWAFWILWTTVMAVDEPARLSRFRVAFARACHDVRHRLSHRAIFFADRRNDRRNRRGNGNHGDVIQAPIAGVVLETKHQRRHPIFGGDGVCEICPRLIREVQDVELRVSIPERKKFIRHATGRVPHPERNAVSRPGNRRDVLLQISGRTGRAKPRTARAGVPKEAVGHRTIGGIAGEIPVSEVPRLKAAVEHEVLADGERERHADDRTAKVAEDKRGAIDAIGQEICCRVQADVHLRFRTGIE